MEYVVLWCWLKIEGVLKDSRACYVRPLPHGISQAASSCVHHVWWKYATGFLCDGGPNSSLQWLGSPPLLGHSGFKCITISYRHVLSFCSTAPFSNPFCVCVCVQSWVQVQFTFWSTVRSTVQSTVWSTVQSTHGLVQSPDSSFLQIPE